MFARFAFASVIVWMSSEVVAGTVHFDPPVALTVSDEPAVFQVSISDTDLASFDSVSIVFQTDPFPGATFTYASSFLDLVSFPPTPPYVFCFAPPCGLVVGGNRFAQPLFQAPLLIGELTIDTTGMALGEYEIVVSASWEEEMIGVPLSIIANGFAQEPLEGRAVIYTGIPEPAAIALLLAGAIVLMARELLRPPGLPA